MLTHLSGRYWLVTVLVAIWVSLGAAWLRTACAAEPVPADTPDDVGLEAGQPAPYRGVLLAPARLRYFLEVETTLDESRAEVDAVRRGWAIDVEEAARVLAACEASRDGCDAEVSPVPAKHSRWYERAGVWAGVAVVAGAVTGALLTSEALPVWSALAGLGLGVAAAVALD